MYLQQPFPDRSKPKMKGEEIVLSIMLFVSASIFMMAQTPVDKSVGKGRQMTSAVVHSNRIEGVKEDKSVELEVKKLLITSKYNLINLVTRRFLRIFAAKYAAFLDK